MSKLSTVIVSALGGLQKAEQVREKYYQDRAGRLLKYYGTELAAMFSEPMIVDQSIRPNRIEQLIEFLVFNCETVICKDGDDVVGIGVFFNVAPGRQATLIGWIAPQYRKGGISAAQKIKEFWNDGVMAYAWDSLNLKKVEAKCCELNRRALAFALKAGFKAVGFCRLDYMIEETLYGSVLFECLNPAYEVQPLKEKRINGRKSKRAAAESVPDNDGNEQYEPGEQPAQPRTDHQFTLGYALSRDIARRNGGRSGSGFDVASISANVEQEPIVSAGGYAAEDSSDLWEQDF